MEIEKQLLKEIEEGLIAREDRPEDSYKYEDKIYTYKRDIKGKGSKAYIETRINMLRQKLLELKKGLK